MPAVSKFTKAKIVTLHVVWANFDEFRVIEGHYPCHYAKMGTHWDGGSASRFWKKAGVFRGTERGTPELSSKSVSAHEEDIALGCTTKWGNDQILTSSVLVVKFFYFKLLILCLINTCYNLLVLWIDLYFEFFDICVPKYTQQVVLT
jgi:hypothetical protein